MKLGDKVVEVLVAGVDVGLCSDRHHLEKYEGHYCSILMQSL